MNSIGIFRPFIDRFTFDKGKFTATDYRNSVLRDLSFLLNTISHVSESEIPDSLNLVRKSVITYGVRSFVGREAAGILGLIEEDLKNAIIKFETRIVPETIKIKAEGINENQLKFIVRGDLKMPMKKETIKLLLSIDVETGQTQVRNT